MNPRPDLQDCCYLDKIIVIPRKRNEKIGKIFLSEIINSAYSHNMESVQLQSAENCLSFYAKNGFFPTRAQLYDDESGVCLTPTILPLTIQKYLKLKQEGIQMPDNYEHPLVAHRQRIESIISSSTEEQLALIHPRLTDYEDNIFTELLRQRMPDLKQYLFLD